MQAYFLKPGTYNYAGRTEKRPLHSDFVMKENFSTVYAMHVQMEKRKAELDMSIEAFVEAHWMTICPKFEWIRVLMDGAKATAAASNVTDFKHPRGCTCSSCETKIGEMACTQKRYLHEQGQQPDSQETHQQMLNSWESVLVRTI